MNSKPEFFSELFVLSELKYKVSMKIKGLKGRRIAEVAALRPKVLNGITLLRRLRVLVMDLYSGTSM